MGYDEDRPVTRGEVTGKPRDRLDVQMVGRLVEQQQVGMIEQRQCERDAAPFAPGETAHRRLDPAREALKADPAEQASEHAAELAVAGPLVLGASADQHVADRLAGSQTIGLVEHADAEPAEAGHPAVVRLLGTRDQLEQGRLALAVAADHADAVPVGDPERDVLQDRARRITLGDGAEVDEITTDTHSGPQSLQGYGCMTLVDETPLWIERCGDELRSSTGFAARRPIAPSSRVMTPGITRLCTERSNECSSCSTLSMVAPPRGFRRTAWMQGIRRLCGRACARPSPQAVI